MPGERHRGAQGTHSPLGAAAAAHPGPGALSKSPPGDSDRQTVRTTTPHGHGLKNKTVTQSEMTLSARGGDDTFLSEVLAKVLR